MGASPCPKLAQEPELLVTAPGATPRATSPVQGHVPAPGVIPKPAAPSEFLSGASRSGSRRIFYTFQGKHMEIPSSEWFYFLPFPFPLSLAELIPLWGDAHGAGPSCPPCRIPPAVLEELQTKEEGTGNFEFPLPEVAGDTEAGAEEKPRVALEEEVETPPAPKNGDQPLKTPNPPASPIPALCWASNPWG